MRSPSPCSKSSSPSPLMVMPIVAIVDASIVDQNPNTPAPPNPHGFERGTPVTQRMPKGKVRSPQSPPHVPLARQHVFEPPPRSSERPAPKILGLHYHQILRTADHPPPSAPSAPSAPTVRPAPSGTIQYRPAPLPNMGPQWSPGPQRSPAGRPSRLRRISSCGYLCAFFSAPWHVRTVVCEESQQYSI